MSSGLRAWPPAACRATRPGAVLGEAVEDLAQAEREGDGGAPVEAAEPVEGGVEVEADDRAERARVGERRAVAVEVGQHVQARGEVGVRGAQLGDAGGDAGVLGGVGLGGRGCG